MAPIKSQNSNMLLAFLTLLGVIAIVAVVGFSCFAKALRLFRGRLKLLNTASQAKFRDVYWSFVLKKDKA